MKNILISIFSFGLSSCSVFASPFENACEEVLLERLYVPGSYRRVAINQISALLSRDEFIAWLEKEEPGPSGRRFMLQQFDAGSESAMQYMMKIDYTAENRAGRTVTEVAICEYTGRDLSNATYYSVSINGMTKMDYLEEQVRRLKQQPQ